MPENDYTASEALTLLLKIVAERMPNLEVELRNAIDIGVVEQTTDRVGSRKKSYLKSRQLTDEEAIEVVLKVLKSYFVQVPSCLLSLQESFINASVGVGHQRFVKNEEEAVMAAGDFKSVDFEVVTATSRMFDREETIPLDRFDLDTLASQKVNFNRVSDLLAFEEQ